MQIATIGLDIAKNVFQVHGIDAKEKVVVRKQLRRSQVMAFFKAFAAVPDRNGGVCHRALLGARVEKARPRGAADAGEGREGALCFFRGPPGKHRV
jgi:transposase